MESKLHDTILTSKMILEKLNLLNIRTYWDILLHIPIRYEDLTKVYSINNASIGTQVLIEGAVISANVLHKRTKQLQVKLSDGYSIITLIFLHFYPNYVTQFQVGKKIRAFGEIKLDYFGQKTIFHPKIQTVKDDVLLPESFCAIYSTVSGLSQKQIIKIVDEALKLLNVPEILPQTFLTQNTYLSFNDAVRVLHQLTPQQFADKLHIKALERLKIDELLAQQLIMLDIYQYKHKNKAIKLKNNHTLTHKLIEQLPFKLTTAQQKVLKEIYLDLNKNTQMNRLLQGDVGSGKTIVATLSMLVAIENGFQSCIVAPTEILAEQHYNKICELLHDFSINIIWLAGSLSAKEKKQVYERIANGDGQIIIGTHAVFQEQVKFKNLAVVVVDEQHRFGVKQRLTLQDKGVNPHHLMMSATPIPRSLAMSYYADLDVSVIDELPVGRKPIKTILINNQRKSEVLFFVNAQTSKGRQVYWVCPLIEESEKLNLENAENLFAFLQSKLPKLNIGLIHGKLKTIEKADVMAKFKTGEIQLLVATSVIEVGVDVPNASIMIIEHSERMGLSSLHQLRGRVGRGSVESTCILLYHNPLSDVAKKRLKAIYENNDGFKIAHEDLLIRGPGEILGDRQSGVPLLKFANLEVDLHLIPQAKELARHLVTHNPESAKLHAQLWFNAQEFYLKT